MTCPCLSCRDARRKGVSMPRPMNDAEALIGGLRPISKDSRRIVVATICGDRVLSTRVEPWRTARAVVGPEATEDSNG
jgi:hypothetical protein